MSFEFFEWFWVRIFYLISKCQKLGKRFFLLSYFKMLSDKQNSIQRKQKYVQEKICILFISIQLSSAVLIDWYLSTEK